MAIYRPTKPRYRIVLVAGFVGLVVGLIAGSILASDDPDAVESVREIRVTLTEASSLLEIVEIEYAEALEDGSGTGEPEYEGAVDALARSRSRWAEARPAVELLAPGDAADIDDRFDELEQAMEDEVLPEELNGMLRDLTEALDPEDP